MTYRVVKRYDHDEGWSCAFRQHKAESHCRFIHGYALAFEFTFECEELNELNWVIDFGGLKWLKSWLQTSFDHMTYVAVNDPEIEWYLEANRRGIIRVIVVENTGCESFAQIAFNAAKLQLSNSPDTITRVKLVSVKVSEHAGNSAIYLGE